MDPFIGQVMQFAGNFAPRGWALCDGQFLAIEQNEALYSILGTQYGGDGRTTFALPDLRGRVPVHPGHGPGLSRREIGQRFGEESVTLTTSEMPSHDHTMSASSGVEGESVASGAFLGSAPIYDTSSAARVAMNPSTISLSGEGLAHENCQPSLAINYIIALYGLYPSRF